MKKFRGLKYRSLTKASPEGRRYIFTRDGETSAIYRRQYFPQDEEWMMTLTSHSGGQLLEWTNPPEAVANATINKNVRVPDLKISDTPGYKPAEVEPQFHVGKPKSQIDAELYQAGVEERNKAREEALKAELIVEPVVEPIEPIEPVEEEPTEEVIPEEPIEVAITKVDSEDWITFVDAMFDTEDTDVFIKNMKLEFNVDRLKVLCDEAGIEYGDTKADTIKALIEKIGE